MKRKLHFLLAVGIGLVASVGWLHAITRPAIFTDLSQANVNRPIIFNVGTATGDTAQIPTVRVKIRLLGDANPAELSAMGLQYHDGSDWKEWSAEDGEYLFGPPQDGFKLDNLISPIKITPKAQGIYTCVLDLVDWTKKNVIVSDTFKVNVSNQADVVSDTNVDYSTPNAYATFHGGKVNGVDIETYSQFPNKKTWPGFYTFVYGNGNETKITDDNGKTQIAVGNNKLSLDPTKSKIVVIGGKKSATVTNTNIVMESGTVRMLVGGGYGVVGANKALDGTAAEVETTTITMTGGTVSGSLIGGGLFYNKTKNVNISLSKTASVGVGGNWVICGGFESGCTNGTKYAEFKNSTNSVEKATLKIDGGTYGIIGIGGTDGANGYVKEVTANIEYATITGGVFGNGSNGRSDKVVGTIAGCTFDGSDIEIAAINRGVVNDVDLTFNGCDFSQATNLHANIGATYRWGYNYNGSSAKVEGVPGSVSMTFIGCNTTPVLGVSDGLADADVTLTGAKAKIAKFEYDKNKYHETLAINTGKTWTFNDGLSMESGVTLTKNGTLKYGKSFDTNVTTADELKAAVALGADVIKLADAMYDLSSTALEINKSMTIQGGDTAKCIVKGALTVSSNKEDNITLQGIRFDYSPNKVSSADSCKPLIGIKGNVNLIVENCRFNNQTAGYGGYNTMLPAKEFQHVFYVAPDATGQLMVENSVINLNANSQSGILVDGAVKDVSLANVKIQGNQDKGSAQFGVYIFHEGTPVTLDKTTIQLNNHYCVIAKHAGNQTLTIKNESNLSGYGAIYLYGTSNMTVNVSEGSILTGNTKNNGISDSFAALVIGSTGEKVSSNNTIVLQDSYIGNRYSAGTTRGMTPIRISSNAIHPVNNKVILKGKTVVRTLNNITNPTMVGYGYDLAEDNNTVILEGQDVQFKDQDEKDCIIINNSNGLFRNASVSIPTAIDFGELYGDTYYHEQIAHAGDKIMITDTTIAKTLISLNAAKDFFFKAPTGTKTDGWEAYTIPDSLIFDCKDGYLVTGKNAADLFANSVTNKAVFYLKQTATEFTAIAAGNNHVQIKANDNVAWNVASNANRSVEIAAGATLTINVAMPLDTVFMAESAQLVANAAVTANAVQLTYGTTKVWKAFGFPFAIGSVKNVAGDKEIKTTASAKDGVWTAGIDDKEPKFTVTGENATPAAACIIASEKDSSIVVTSTGSTLSLATKAEPNAPVVTKANDVNFKIYSNPNLSDMTLTQTAYVLSEDGKTFDRMVNPTIKAFQSFVLADEATTSTLRSLRIGDTPTGNEIVPVEGYFVETGHGTITIHTAEPTQVIVVDMLGRVHYNARVNDGAQIAVPAGIYAVNRQKVIVK